MACLTRNMQKQLADYIKTIMKDSWRENPDGVHKALRDKGVIPASITQDQVSAIVKNIH